jgi:membrane protease YdiL (CAAX protease family)
MISNIFLNRQDHRLRALWRLLIQTALFWGLLMIFNLAVGVVAGTILVSRGAAITDTETFLAALDHPLLRVVSGLISFGIMALTLKVMGKWIDHRTVRDYGFHFSPRWWADFTFGLVLGAVLMTIVFSVELAAGWITVSGFMQSTRADTSFLGGLLASVVVVICVGFYEEMLSRGYQMRNMAEGLNLRGIGPRGGLLLAYLVSSSIFGLLHMGNPSATLTSTINIIIAGLLLGLGFLLTGELAIPIGLHITWNFFQGNVFGFPVSGLDFNASFINIRQGGPELWTGGAFGPEAGLIGLAAILLGMLLTVLWVRARYGSAAPRDALAVYTPPSGRFLDAEAARTAAVPSGEQGG